jgi:hypothetical protein
MIINLLKQVWELLKDRRVKLSTKLIYVLSVTLYVIAPVIPFMPLDDFLVFLVGSYIFTRVAKKEAGYNRDVVNKKRDKSAIDIEGKIIEEE